MTIYGTALLSACLVVGLLLGRCLGLLLGVEANIGGVGIAMILLILVSSRLQSSGHLPRSTEGGILFWSSIYIPVVVAMAASQNVKAALSGGTVALLAGVLVVVVSFLLVPLLSRMGGSHQKDENEAPQQDMPGGRR